ncbi:hypothetical protein I5M32_11200 [Pedobacter sp. SD-b]|uniref:Uncharacterized protein n=1 Tax=Pedobacter segetis TaxID=2793069 RepID=A0ABS1BKU9_9SPHI|nr:hypothetical protein [Pedobacter segetis]MBK0383523.1 hypothetical protein [Pedobacter segetis]
MPQSTRPTYAQILKEPRTYLMYVAITLCVTVTVYTLKYAQKVADKAQQSEKDCQTEKTALINTLLIKNHIIDAIKQTAPLADSAGVKSAKK